MRNANVVFAAAEDRLKKGVGTAMDVAEARQGVAQGRLLVAQATGGEQSAYVDLLAAVGLPPTTRIRIADVGNRKLSAAMARPVDRILDNALSRRPDILQAFAAEKASQARLQAAQADLLPKAFMSGAANYNGGDVTTSTIFPSGYQTPIANLAGGRYGGTVLLGVATPIYDGGVREAVMQQARAGVENAGLKMAHARQQAIRQIVTANVSLNSSLAVHDAARELVASSQTAFDAALASYQNGVGSITALSLAQTRLLQARNAQVDSYSAALSAAALLALATGSLGSAPP